MLDDSDTWTELLGKKLKENFVSVWINNAGLDGHTTFGHIVLMRDYIVSIKPKIALFLLGINDVGTTAPKSYDESRYRLGMADNDRLVAALAEKLEIVSTVLNLYRYKEAVSRGLAHRVVQISDATVDFNLLGVSDDSSDTTGAVLAIHAEEFIPAYKNRLRELIDLTKSNGIEPVFITQPVIYGEGVDDITGKDLSLISVPIDIGLHTESMSGRQAWEFLELYNEAARQVAREQDIFLVDLARQMPKSTEYYYDFVHYSKTGSEKVAATIYQSLCPYLGENQAHFATRPCE